MTSEIGNHDRERCWPLREIIAKAYAYKSVGDPHAFSVNGVQRWNWFTDQADKFIEVFGHAFRSLSFELTTEPQLTCPHIDKLLSSRCGEGGENRMNAIDLNLHSFDSLIDALEHSGPSFQLDRYIASLAGYRHDVNHLPPFTASIDSAIGLVRRVLPGWGWRVATCSVSDDAWVFPDFNSPVSGNRLKASFREDLDWAGITDVDLRPSGRGAIALCIAVLKAKKYVSEG